MQKKLYLIDGSAFLYRAYYALPYLSNSRGFPTRVVFGFLKMLTKILKEHTPSHIVVIFDSKRKTFRTEMYDQYKIKRPPLPEEIRIQIPNVYRLLDSLNIEVLVEDGLEADDLIASLVRRFKSELPIVITTADKDLFQLIDENVKIWHPQKDIFIDRAKVYEILGIQADYITDYLALAGDQSDGIPGIKGIGEKTARALVERFGTLESVYSHINEIQGKVKELLIQQKDMAFLSKSLCTLKITDLDKYELDNFKIREPKEIELRELLKELNFFDFISEFEINKGIDLSPPKILSYKNWKAIPSQKTFFLLSSEDNQPVLFLTQDGEKIFTARKDEIKSIFSSINSKNLYSFEGKNIFKYLSSINMSEIDFIDLSLYSYLVYPNANHVHSLEDILKDNLGFVPEPKGAENQLFQEDIDKRSFLLKFVPSIANRLEKEIGQELELLKLYEQIEYPLSKILAKMEIWGIKLDINHFKKINLELEERIRSLQEKIFNVAGVQFNLNSPKQLSQVLYEHLNIKRIKKGNRSDSTAQDVLLELFSEHPVIPLIIEYRNLSKIKSTYVDVLPDYVDKDSRIHTTFNQTLTATGRLSSSNPNLQNIPIKFDWGEKIRSAFIADDGYLLLSADYSQIEIRVLAQMSGDENLIEDFLAGRDIHTATAVKIFETSPNKVTKDMRRQAKTINFGILYGMGSFSLSKELGVSQKEAELFIKKYFENYKKVREFRDGLIEFARSHKYVKTYFGRKRYLYEIDSPDHLVRNNAERIALNTPLQGTAADIVKKAMIDVYKALQKNNIDFKMLLQVHDEILLEISENQIEMAKNIVKECMEQVVKFKVPLEVKVGVGRNWFDAAK